MTRAAAGLSRRAPNVVLQDLGEAEVPAARTPRDGSFGAAFRPTGRAGAGGGGMTPHPRSSDRLAVETRGVSPHPRSSDHADRNTPVPTEHVPSPLRTPASDAR